MVYYGDLSKAPHQSLKVFLFNRTCPKGGDTKKNTNTNTSDGPNLNTNTNTNTWLLLMSNTNTNTNTWKF